MLRSSPKASALLLRMRSDAGLAEIVSAGAQSACRALSEQYGTHFGVLQVDLARFLDPQAHAA